MGARPIGLTPLRLASVTSEGQRSGVLRGAILATSWGIVGDNATDNATAMEALRVYLSAQTSPPKVIWPAGIYRYSVSPNWAIADTIHEAVGEVRFRYTGTGNALIIDGGAAGGGVYNTRFGVGGRFIVEAPASALNAVYVRAMHHGHVGVKVLGAGSAYAGLKTHWCVCTQFDVTVSVNEEGWYSSAMPDKGIDLDIRGAGEFTSYCYFPNAIVEGPPVGIKLTGTLGNLFVGGTSEGCSSYGVHATTGAYFDEINHVDMESNGADVLNEGDGISFNGCDTTTTVTFTSSSKRGVLRGGRHKTISLAAGSRSHRVFDLEYNRVDASGGTFTDSGAGNVVDYNSLVDGTNNLAQIQQTSRVDFHDDFLGGALSSVSWTTFKGTDAQALLPDAVEGIIGGRAIFVGGDDAGGTMALNGTQLNAKACQWKVSAGGFYVEFRILITPITNCAWFFGMTDQVAALEMPFTISGTTLTSNTSNGFGLLFDTDATTDNFKLVGVATDVDATTQDLGVAPTDDTYERWRLEATTAGVVTAYRNGVAIGSALSGAVTAGTLLTPVMCGFSRTASSAVAALDYIRIGAKRA